MAFNLYQSRAGAQVIAVDTSSDGTLGTAGLASNSLIGAGGVLNPNNVLPLPADFNAIAGVLNGSNGVVSPPGAITGLSASWSGTTLVVTWTFDTTVSTNQYLQSFLLTFASGSTQSVKSYNINKSSSSQTYSLTLSANGTLFGAYALSFTGLTVSALDAYGNAGASQTIVPPAYTSSMPQATITFTSLTNGYTVTGTNQPTDPSLNYLEIEEWVDTTSSITSSSNIPGGATYTQVALSSVNPVTIVTADTNWRWIRAKWTDKIGGAGTYSAIAGPVKPNPVVVVNTTPPTEVVSASATFSSSGAGSDIVVTFTLPATNFGTSFIIKLIPAAAPSLYGQFYYFPTSTSASQTLTYTISKASLYAQFGTYYPTFTGAVFSVSGVGNISAGTGSTAQIGSFSHTNALYGITPTFSLVASANGYGVTWTNITGATYADIYESATSFALPSVSTFSSTGSGGTAVATFVFASTVASLLTTGQHFSIKSASVSQFNNEFIVVSVNTTTVTANPILSTGSTFTATTSTSGAGIVAEFNPTSEALRVYAGPSPITIQSLNYSTRYIKIRNYSDFGDTSNYAFQQSVVPYDPGLLSIISNPVSFQTNGTILAGGYNSTTLQPTYPNVFFNSSGIFAYDTGGTPTTQIINNVATGGTTFITKQAQIADWIINPYKIENTYANVTATATGTINTNTITVPNASAVGIYANMNVTGTGIATGAYVVGNPSVGASVTTITLSANNTAAVSGSVTFSVSSYVGMSASGTYAFWAGSTTAGGSSTANFTVTPSGVVTARNITIIGNGGSSNLISAGGLFSVTNAGVLNATSANITGTINASGGTFTGNVQVTTGGSLYAGSLSGSHVAIGSAGISAFDTNGTTQTTSISGAPSTGGVTFTTKAAQIGSFFVDSNYIMNASTSTSATFLLSAQSVGEVLTIKDSATSGVYSLGLAVPASGAGTTKVIYAGPSGAPNWYVTANGTMTATGATIQSSGSYFVKLDGANNSISTYGLPSNNPGSIQTFSATITGGAIQSSYASAITLNTTPYTTTLSAGNITSTGWMSVVSAYPFQIFNNTNTNPLFSVDPTGTYSIFSETIDGVVTVAAASSTTTINTVRTFINGSNIIIGSGPGSSYLFNGQGRIRNSTPVGAGTGSYIRNIYIGVNSPSGSGTGFDGDVYLQY